VQYVVTDEGDPKQPFAGSFADGAGEHVIYMGADQHVHQLYFSGTWVDQDLTALSPCSMRK
jgi:hypothetical protein